MTNPVRGDCQICALSSSSQRFFGESKRGKQLPTPITPHAIIHHLPLVEPIPAASDMSSTAEDKNDKAEPLQGPQLQPRYLTLDLSLSSGDTDQGSSVMELNLLGKFDTTTASPPPSVEISPAAAEAETRVFTCNYCQRKFYSSQALGGHQNAHKRERMLAKRGQRFGYPYSHRYSSMASLPLHGSLHRPFGIQAHSMIHKPAAYSNFSASSAAGLPYAHHGWSRPLIDQQLAIGRLAVGVGGGKGGAAAKLDGAFLARPFGASVEAVPDDTIGGCWRAGDGAAPLKSHQQENLQKIDLPLKL